LPFAAICLILDILLIDVDLNFSLFTSVKVKLRYPIVNFFCVGVMYSDEYDVCDVTLSVISTPDKLGKYAWPRHSE
jgi:hypothetical protein